MEGTPDLTPTSESSGPEVFSAHDQSILDFERQWWQHAGAKEQAIRAEFGLSAARYYQLLGGVIDSPLAVAYDPMLVKRLHRMRDSRSQARVARSLHPID